jgi:hypothetical protein
MRLRIENVALGGTSRSVDFRPGLNVVLSSTTTGKTSLMRLLRVLLGSNFDGIIPELKRVPNLLGTLRIDDDQFSIVRRLSQTSNAPVDIAGEGLAVRLPAMTSDKAEKGTYGDWVIDRLGLAHLRIPTAPSQPAESATTPMSIADYLRYCRLTEKQIDIDVLGSSNFFTDYKRRVAFQIYVGTFDVRIAELQEQLRTAEGELRAIQSGMSAFDEFLEGTALENRAEIEAKLERARVEVAEFVARRRELPDEIERTPAAVEATQGLRGFDRDLADLEARRESEAVAEEQMAELARQLRAQSARLTKAVVAGSHLVDFDFLICPRCGQHVTPGRSDDEHCYLCLQVPGQEASREDLLVEQARIEAQIAEADELQGRHASAVQEIDARLTDVRARRTEVAVQLDQLTQSFVSDRADEIARLASGQSRAESSVARFEDYLRLFDKADASQVRGEELRSRRGDIEEQLLRAEHFDSEARNRIDHLESRFAHFVEAVGMPEFSTESEPRAAIHRGTFKPIVNGRTVEDHSAGMALLTNIVYMLAIHQTTIELDLKIPRLLMIDGISKNLGRGEYDQRRSDLVWTQLAEFHQQYAEDLQIIVAANDVPDFIEDLDVVRLRLSEADRLVPEEDEAEGPPEAEGESGDDGHSVESGS